MSDAIRESAANMLEARREYRDLAERILARIHPAMNWYPDASGAENRIARVTGGEPALVDILAQALEAEGV